MFLLLLDKGHVSWQVVFVVTEGVGTGGRGASRPVDGGGALVAYAGEAPTEVQRNRKQAFVGEPPAANVAVEYGLLPAKGETTGDIIACEDEPGVVTETAVRGEGAQVGASVKVDGPPRLAPAEEAGTAVGLEALAEDVGADQGDTGLRQETEPAGRGDVVPGKGEAAHVGLDHVQVGGAHEVAGGEEVRAHPGRGDACGVGGVKVDVHEVGVGLDPGTQAGFLDEDVVVVEEKEEGDTGGGGWHDGVWVGVCGWVWTFYIGIE